MSEVRHQVRLWWCGVRRDRNYRAYLRTQLGRALSKRNHKPELRARLLIEQLIEVGRPDVRAAVLCIGSRNTFELDCFKKRGYTNVIGIDLFSESPDILLMDMHDMSFPDDQFSVIYSSHSLEHAYDARIVAGEIIRVARDGALVAVEAPVQYETKGADLIDFVSLENLLAIFQPYVGEVLLSEHHPPHSPRNDGGTAVLRAVFVIRKPNSAIKANIASRLRPVKLNIDGRIYKVRVLQRTAAPYHAPRLVVVSYLPNTVAQEVLRACLRAIQRYTLEPHELWVVDNNSPCGNVDWLLQWPNLNVVLSRTEPVPAESRGVLAFLRGRANQQDWGSYANAVALELAARLIDPQSRYLMTLHMDTMPCRTGWLAFLQSKLCDGVVAAGVRMDTARTPEGALHMLGCLLDFQLFQQLHLDFLPRLPQYDVGGRAITALREAGHALFACRNTLWAPQLVETISPSSPLRHLNVDRAFDDDGNVIFLHLGRGVRKSSGEYSKGVTPEEWIRFAHEHLLV